MVNQPVAVASAAIAGLRDRLNLQTEGEFLILRYRDEMACTGPRVISDDRLSTPSTRSDSRPTLGDVSLLRIPMYSRPHSEIPLGEMSPWVRQTYRRRA